MPIGRRVRVAGIPPPSGSALDEGSMAGGRRAVRPDSPTDAGGQTAQESWLLRARNNHETVGTSDGRDAGAWLPAVAAGLRRLRLAVGAAVPGRARSGGSARPSAEASGGVASAAEATQSSRMGFSQPSVWHRPRPRPLRESSPASIACPSQSTLSCFSNRRPTHT